MVGILVLLVLLLPATGAVIARIAGRKFGPKATAIVGALGFAGALGSALALHWVAVDRSTLGSWAIFIPQPGPVIDAVAFTLPRQPVETQPPEPPVVALAEPSPTLESVTAAPFDEIEDETGTVEPPAPTLPTAAATPSPTVMIPPTSPTPTPTDAPTPAPTGSPTAAPTASPTAAPQASATARPRPVAPTATSRPARAQAYMVKPGDTLRGIAERFGVSVDALLRYNGLSPEEGDSLRLDQELSIPPQSSSDQAATSRPTSRPAAPTSRPTTRSIAPTSRPTVRPTARAAAPTTGPSARIQLYVVKPGDTLRSIAAKFDIGVDALLRYNGLTRAEGDLLRPDQKLYIPPQR